MATKQEKVEATPKHVLCENAIKHDLQGVNPFISINKDGCVIMVYQHWKPGLHGVSQGIYYCQGTMKDKKITWGVEQTLETEGYSVPKVSIANDGTVILVYGKGTRCYYRIGSVQKGGSVSWDAQSEQIIDEGAQPCVSIDKQHTVVVTFISNNHGYARIGAIDQSTKKIVWKDDKFEVTPEKVEDLAMAINQNKDVVVAYRTGVMKSTVHCKYGKIEAGKIVFTGAEKELKGYYPTVSLNKNGRVLVVFEQLSPLRKILVQSGEVEKSSGVQWKDTAPDVIDSGHRPSVSLTEKGEFVEIHESHLPVVDQSIFYRIGQLL